MESKPKRRVRYKGTHPRKFSEKYKEKKPEKYSDDIEKIKARGATPAGTHRPICVTEILETLRPQPGEIALDVTLGYGGHSTEILKKILPGGRLIGLDQDPIEILKTEARLREQFKLSEGLSVIHSNFRDAAKILDAESIQGVDMILADLGLSSMQIDDPERGFTFKVDGPFDLRMNPQEGIPASQFLQTIGSKKLAEILVENADEPFADLIATALKKSPVETTTEAAQIIKSAIKDLPKRVLAEQGDAPVRRTFQALRIALNDEYGALDKFLSDLPRILRRGGRVAILSFHSGEDRRVKKAFQAFERSGVFRKVAPEIIRPSPEEQRSNPRSKSAKLRWAIK